MSETAEIRARHEKHMRNMILIHNSAHVLVSWHYRVIVLLHIHGSFFRKKQIIADRLAMQITERAELCS